MPRRQLAHKRSVPTASSATVAIARYRSPVRGRAGDVKTETATKVGHNGRKGSSCSGAEHREGWHLEQLHRVLEEVVTRVAIKVAVCETIWFETTEH